MLKLDEEILNEILRGEVITTAESDFFDCSVQWVQHDESNRSKLVPSLANSIRLKHIPNAVSEIVCNSVLRPVNISDLMIEFQFLSEIFEPFYGFKTVDLAAKMW